LIEPEGSGCCFDFVFRVIALGVLDARGDAL
jgi:hypothetical protein